MLDRRPEWIKHQLFQQVATQVLYNYCKPEHNGFIQQYNSMIV